jgi:hypothetical protein
MDLTEQMVGRLFPIMRLQVKFLKLIKMLKSSATSESQPMATTSGSLSSHTFEQLQLVFHYIHIYIYFSLCVTVIYRSCNVIKLSIKVLHLMYCGRNIAVCVIVQ